MQAMIVAMTISLSAVGCHHKSCHHGRSHGCYGGGYRSSCYSSCYSGCYSQGYAQPASYAPSYPRSIAPSGQAMGYAPAYGSPSPMMTSTPGYGTAAPSNYSSSYGPPPMGRNAAGTIGRGTPAGAGMTNQGFGATQGFGTGARGAGTFAPGGQPGIPTTAPPPVP